MKNYRVLLKGEYSEGDKYFEEHKTINEAATRLIDLIIANDDDELNIPTFTISLEEI